MRLLSSLITLAVIATVIAALTVPSKTKFQEFIDKKYADSVHLSPIITDTSVHRLFGFALFTKNTVSLAESGRSIGPTDSTRQRNPSFNLQIIRYSERYLGLFGRF